MTVTLPNLTIERVFEVLKRQNALFCPASKVGAMVQKEFDRQLLLQTHMQMMDS
jgi:hypothetical protein